MLIIEMCYGLVEVWIQYLLLLLYMYYSRTVSIYSVL